MKSRASKAETVDLNSRCGGVDVAFVLAPPVLSMYLKDDRIVPDYIHHGPSSHKGYSGLSDSGPFGLQSKDSVLFQTLVRVICSIPRGLGLEGRGETYVLLANTDDSSSTSRLSTSPSIVHCATDPGIFDRDCKV